MMKTHTQAQLQSDKIIFCTMFINLPQRQRLSSHRRAFSSRSDDSELDPRGYRILHTLFAHNLNNYIHNLQDSLPDLQDQPTLRITAGQRQVFEARAGTLYQRHILRLSRQNTSRNGNITRLYQEFCKQYKNYLSRPGNTKQQQQNALGVKCYTQHQRNSGQKRRFSFNTDGTGPQWDGLASKTYDKGSPFMERPATIRSNYSEYPQRTKDWARSRTSLKKETDGEMKNRSMIEGGGDIGFLFKGQSVMITQAVKCQEWQMEKGGLTKPAQSVGAKRVLALRNRVLTNPEHEAAKGNIRQGYNMCVCVIQPQSFVTKKKYFSRMDIK